MGGVLAPGKVYGYVAHVPPLRESQMGKERKKGGLIHTSFRTVAPGGIASSF
jgi:hypothetical protein